MAPSKKRATGGKSKTKSRSRSPARRRSASPAKKKVTLAGLRKKGIENLTNKELNDYINRTRLARARKTGFRLADLGAWHPLLSYKNKTRAELIKIAKRNDALLKNPKVSLR